VCFNAASEEEVKAFHHKALELGGEDEGKPGIRPEYTEGYFAAFVRDPDGNKIEAMCWVKKG
jgi:predicted lactoylglutathione lyase